MASDTRLTADPLRFILEDAARNLTKLYEGNVADHLAAENDALKNDLRALRDEIATLNEGKSHRHEADHGIELPLGTPVDSIRHGTDIHAKLLAASSQIIHVRDDLLALHTRNDILEAHVLRLNTALQDARASELSAKAAAESARQQYDQSKVIADRLLEEKAELEKRLNKEMRVYEKSVNGKERLIAELEQRVHLIEKSGHARKPSVEEKENSVIYAMAEPVNLTPLRDLPVSHTPKSSYEMRYKALKKSWEVLGVKYDALKRKHDEDHATFKARLARWDGWKELMSGHLAKIIDGPSTVKAISSATPLEVSLSPAMAKTGRTEKEPPSTSTRALRTALVNSCVAKLAEIDREDGELHQLITPVPPFAALNVAETSPASPAFVDSTREAHSAISNLVSALDGSPHPVVSSGRHRPRHYSPTISENPLSQLPQARLRDLDMDIAAAHTSTRSPTTRKPLELPPTGQAAPVSPMLELPPFAEDVNRPPAHHGPPALPPSETSKPSLPVWRSKDHRSRSVSVKPEPQTQVLVMIPPVRGEGAAPKGRSSSSPPESPRKKSTVTPIARSASGTVLGKRKAPSQPRAIATVQEQYFDGGENVASGSRSRVMSLHQQKDEEEPRAGTKKKRASDPTSDYSRYKGHGRYAKVSAAQPITALYEIDKAKNNGLDFQYDEVVRNKEKRKQMHGTDCECCKDYYNAVGYLPPKNRAPRWRSPTPAQSPVKKRRTSAQRPKVAATAADDVSALQTTDSMASLSSPAGLVDDDPQRFDAQQLDQRRNDISRHRHNWAPAGTPPDYWQIGFPTTQQIESINRRADAHYDAKRDRIAQDANNPNGRYKKKR